MAKAQARASKHDPAAFMHFGFRVWKGKKQPKQGINLQL